MIQVNNLNFSYNKKLFKGLNFSLKEGEFLALLGANGSGKSTLLDILAGTLKAKVESIIINNKNNNFQEVAILPQNIEHWLLGETAREDLALGLNLKNAEVLKLYNLTIEKWQLAEFLDEELINLSLGQKKRLAIAATLIKKPKIILLDEPFAGLDWAGSLLMLEHLEKLKAEKTTLILASHEVKIIEKLIDKCLILKNADDYLWGPLNELSPKFLEYGVRPLNF